MPEIDPKIVSLLAEHGLVAVTAAEKAVLDAMAQVDETDLLMALELCESDAGDPLYPAMQAELARREATR